MIMRKFIEKSDEIMEEAYEDLENGKDLKAYIKASKSGIIEGFGDGVLIIGLFYATIGTAYLICKACKIKVN